MIICVCNGISDVLIKKTVENGCDDFIDLMEILGVADECGTCFDDAYRVFEKALSDN